MTKEIEAFAGVLNADISSRYYLYITGTMIYGAVIFRKWRKATCSRRFL